MDKLLELWKRWEDGLRISECKFDALLADRVNRLKTEYEIRYNPIEVIPQDMNMTDGIFNAAIELLTDVGVYCYDTSMVIKIKEDEIHDAIKKIPDIISLGTDNDKVEYSSKNIEEKGPLICGGPTGCPISEELYSKILYSYAKEDIDSIISGTLQSYNNRGIKKGTPVEIAAVLLETSLTREVIKRANKPGLCIVGPMSGIAATALNSALSPSGMRTTDIHIVALLNELKIDLNLLNRIYYLQQNNVVLEIGQCPLLGYTGGPEETAIISVAEILFDYLLGAKCAGFSPTSMRFSVSTDRKTLWVAACVLLATKKRLKPLINSWIWAGAGPCTEMICHEIAAQTIVETVCGIGMIISAGGTKGTHVDHYTGMEAKVAIEVREVAKMLNIKEANDIVNELLRFYEGKILSEKIPIGKSFPECYSLDDISPSLEYLNVFERAKIDFENIGLMK